MNCEAEEKLPLSLRVPGTPAIYSGPEQRGRIGVAELAQRKTPAGRRSARPRRIKSLR